MRNSEWKNDEIQIKQGSKNILEEIIREGAHSLLQLGARERSDLERFDGDQDTGVRQLVVKSGVWRTIP